MDSGNVIGSFVDGLLALIRGVTLSVRSPQVRKAYTRFTIVFAAITILGYLLLSTTMFLVLPIFSVLLLGPCIGPVVLIIFCTAVCILSFILWLFGWFPKSILTGRFGILSPFFSLPQISFLLTSLVTSMACDQFFLHGAEACYGSGNEASTAIVEKMRTSYKKPSWILTLRLTCCNAIFDLFLRSILLMLPLSDGRLRNVFDVSLSAYLLGCQVATVYTVRIRRGSFLEHLSWCTSNIPKILGFALPLQLTQVAFGWMGTIFWLGLGYSASAALMDDFILGYQHRRLARLHSPVTD